MTALQMNAELFHALGTIADDEGLMKQALKYLKKLAAKKEDETLMTEEQLLLSYGHYNDKSTTKYSLLTEKRMRICVQ